MIVFTNKAFFNLCQNFVLASLVLLVLNTKLTLVCGFFFKNIYIYIYIYIEREGGLTYVSESDDCYLYHQTKTPIGFVSI